MVVGLLLVAASSFVALTVHSMTTLLACLVLQGVGSACYGTSALSAVTDRGTPQTRVRDMAAYQTATQIGLSLGPGLGGFAAALWGYGAPFACQGLMALIALIAVMRIPNERRVAECRRSESARRRHLRAHRRRRRPELCAVLRPRRLVLDPDAADRP